MKYTEHTTIFFLKTSFRRNDATAPLLWKQETDGLGLEQGVGGIGPFVVSYAQGTQAGPHSR